MFGFLIILVGFRYINYFIFINEDIPKGFVRSSLLRMRAKVLLRHKIIFSCSFNF